MFTICETTLTQIITKAFSLGEDWAVTYHGWFTPDDKDHKQRLNEAIEECRSLVNESNEQST